MSDGTMTSMLPSPESSKLGLMRRRFVVQSRRSRPPIRGTCQSKKGRRLESAERPRGELLRFFNLLLLRPVAAQADAHDGVALQHVQRAGKAIAAPDGVVAPAADAHALRLALPPRFVRPAILAGEGLPPEGGRVPAHVVDRHGVGEPRQRKETLR